EPSRNATSPILILRREARSGDWSDWVCRAYHHRAAPGARLRSSRDVPQTEPKRSRYELAQMRPAGSAGDAKTRAENHAHAPAPPRVVRRARQILVFPAQHGMGRGEYHARAILPGARRRPGG